MGTYEILIRFIDGSKLILPKVTEYNWYKHLGRTNTCNKEGFTLADLKELLLLLKEDLK